MSSCRNSSCRSSGSSKISNSNKSAAGPWPGPVSGAGARQLVLAACLPAWVGMIGVLWDIPAAPVRPNRRHPAAPGTQTQHATLVVLYEPVS